MGLDCALFHGRVTHSSHSCLDTSLACRRPVSPPGRPPPGRPPPGVSLSTAYENEPGQVGPGSVSVEGGESEGASVWSRDSSAAARKLMWRLRSRGSLRGGRPPSAFPHDRLKELLCSCGGACVSAFCLRLLREPLAAQVGIGLRHCAAQSRRATGSGTATPKRWMRFAVSLDCRPTRRRRRRRGRSF